MQTPQDRVDVVCRGLGDSSVAIIIVTTNNVKTLIIAREAHPTVPLLNGSVTSITRACDQQPCPLSSRHPE